MFYTIHTYNNQKNRNKNILKIYKLFNKCLKCCNLSKSYNCLKNFAIKNSSFMILSS